MIWSLIAFGIALMVASTGAFCLGVQRLRRLRQLLKPSQKQRP